MRPRCGRVCPFTMRIDLEQFLALTVALGTAGAVGAAVYITKADAETQPSAQVEPTPAPYPEAEPDPATPPAEPAAEPAVSGDGEIVDTVLVSEEDLTDVPAPYAEGAWMNS